MSVIVESINRFNNLDKVNLLCVLDKVRMYFGQNPQDFDE